MKKIFVCIIAITCFYILTGCASWSKHGVSLSQPKKMRIAVLPVQFEVKVKKLKYIKDISGIDLHALDEKDLIQKEIERIKKEIDDFIEKQLGSSYFFELAPRQDVEKALATLGIQPVKAELTAEKVKKLGEMLDVRALMVIKVSGYGAIKKKWQVLLLGSGVVEAVAQGLIVEKVIGNEPLAILVASEEILSETITWVGGIYFFNHIFSPVILESKLISTNDGKVFWKNTAFSTVDRKALKKLPKKEQKLKELRLKATYEKAIKELNTKLQKKAVNNIQ